MRYLFAVGALAVLSGCSSSVGESSSSSVGESSSSAKLPDSLVGIKELHTKFENEVEYKELVGKKVSINGIFRNYLDFGEDGFRISVSEEDDEDSFPLEKVECTFDSSILKKCLPGQSVVIEGTVFFEDDSVQPRLNNCRLVNVSGEHEVEGFDAFELDSDGLLTLNSKAIVTGKVTQISREDDKWGEDVIGQSVFVDLQSKDKVCIQFSLPEKDEPQPPRAEKINAIKVGDSIRVVGATKRKVARNGYEGVVLIAECEILD